MSIEVSKEELPLDHEVLITVAMIELAGFRATARNVSEQIGVHLSSVKRAIAVLKADGRLTVTRGCKGGLSCTGRQSADLVN